VFDLIYLIQAAIITPITSFLDCSGFFLFMSCVLAIFYSKYYGTLRMQRSCNARCVRNLLGMLLQLNESLKLAESIITLHTRLLRPSTNFRTVLQCILHSLCVIDNGTEEHCLLPRMFMPNEVHLRPLEIQTY